MTAFYRNWAKAALVIAALQSSLALAQPALKPPLAPSGIQAPAGNDLFLSAHARGTQNYVCLPTTSGFAWTFFSPQATLFYDFKWFGSDIRQQIITHFLSPNPAENDTPRVTWQSSLDTSAVRAKAIAASTDPNFVKDGAIPWVLLQAVGTQRGPNGGEILARTTFVQRLNTAGGAAPSDGCSQPENVGTTALVPYTADYFFYKASPKN